MSLWTFFHGQPHTIATRSGGATLGFWVDESGDINGDMTSMLKWPARISDINEDAMLMRRSKATLRTAHEARRP
jgi:hypothetical protein